MCHGLACLSFCHHGVAQGAQRVAHVERRRAVALGKFLAPRTAHQRQVHGDLVGQGEPVERCRHPRRAIALGRKNYLFVGSEAGGKAAAIAYTLIETAKINTVDPLAWLADTIARIPDYKITKVDDLLPWRWNR